MDPKEVIVCLGLALERGGTLRSELIERCKVAAELNKTRNLPIINTGGDPGHTGISEARAMTDYMVAELGVDKEDVFVEDKAVTTCGNAVETLEIMENKSSWIGTDSTSTGKKASILLVTSEYHMPRSSHVFKSFFQAENINLTVEEHPAKNVEDPQRLITEKRIMEWNNGLEKYKIRKLEEHETAATMKKIEILLEKYTGHPSTK
eukprot:GFUD01012956.1.p1 GENE.GFUD01012956.1~~GFUD01012956.1.p1  ORF type:complete len:206 (+),score=57.05 GFUD01012956.1:49-666(+)